MGTYKQTIKRVYTQEFDGKYISAGDGAVKAKGNRRDFDKHLMEQYLHVARIHPDVTPQQFRSDIVERLEDVTIACVGGCLDIDEALTEFVKEKDLHISPDGKKISMGPYVDVAPMDLKEHFKDFCFRKNANLTKEDVKYSPEAMYAAFHTDTQKRNVEVWYDIQREIAYDPKDGKALPKTLGSVLEAIRVSSKDRERFNADRLMFAHWMWTLKRRICKLDFSPALPLMLVFRGRQGGGKTSFIENHLGSVFKQKVVSADLSVIHDSREFRKWTENVIVNFDELSMRGLHDGHRVRTPELLKQLLTSSYSQERTFHTQTQQTYQIRATFCCTTNKPLAESISDPTGMRRYWEIICDTTESIPDFDWDVLESMDWLALWRGVDENKRGGYVNSTSKYFPKMEEVQDTYCVQPALRSWFEDNYTTFIQRGLTELTAKGIAIDDELIAKDVYAYSLLHLYGEYADLMQEIGGYAVSQPHFLACMKKLGVHFVPRSSTHTKTKYLVVRKVKA